jgi:hypothetical protein
MEIGKSGNRIKEIMKLSFPLFFKLNEETGRGKLRADPAGAQGCRRRFRICADTASCLAFFVQCEKISA